MPIKHTAHPKDEYQIHEAPAFGCREVFVEGLEFFPIPIIAEPRDDVGPDTVQKDRIPDYCFKIEGHGFVRANGWVEVVGGELFQAAFCFMPNKRQQNYFGGWSGLLERCFY